MNFSMTDFMFSSTYLTQVLGNCQEAEAERVAYHARAILAEMREFPDLEILWRGDHRSIEMYKQSSVAWEIMMHDFECIEARAEKFGKRLYADRWHVAVTKLLNQYFDCEERLAEEKSPRLPFNPSAISEIDDDVF